MLYCDILFQFSFQIVKSCLIGGSIRTTTMTRALRRLMVTGKCWPRWQEDIPRLEVNDVGMSSKRRGLTTTSMMKTDDDSAEVNWNYWARLQVPHDLIIHTCMLCGHAKLSWHFHFKAGGSKVLQVRLSYFTYFLVKYPTVPNFFVITLAPCPSNSMLAPSLLLVGLLWDSQTTKIKSTQKLSTQKSVTTLQSSVKTKFSNQGFCPCHDFCFTATLRQLQQ